MPLTFYTVQVGKPGYPVKYCQPVSQNPVEYGPVQTFTIESLTFSDPGEACGEFEAWIGPDVEVCYLHEQQFNRKVRALHQMRRDAEKKLASWNAMATRQ